jgi:hypothetical protein
MADDSPFRFRAAHTGADAILRTEQRATGPRYYLASGAIVVFNIQHQRYGCLTCKLATPCDHTRAVHAAIAPPVRPEPLDYESVLGDAPTDPDEDDPQP